MQSSLQLKLKKKQVHHLKITNTTWPPGHWQLYCWAYFKEQAPHCWHCVDLFVLKRMCTSTYAAYWSLRGLKSEHATWPLTTTPCTHTITHHTNYATWPLTTPCQLRSPHSWPCLANAKWKYHTGIAIAGYKYQIQIPYSETTRQKYHILNCHCGS